MVNEVKIWPWTDEPWYVAQTARWNAMIADGWTFQPPLPRTGYIGMEMTLLDNLARPLRSHSIWLSRGNQTPEELHSAILEWCESQARASTPAPSVSEVWDRAIRIVKQCFPDERLVRASTVIFALESERDQVVPRVHLQPAPSVQSTARKVAIEIAEIMGFNVDVRLDARTERECRTSLRPG